MRSRLVYFLPIITNHQISLTLRGTFSADTCVESHTNIQKNVRACVNIHLLNRYNSRLP